MLAHTCFHVLSSFLLIFSSLAAVFPQPYRASTAQINPGRVWDGNNPFQQPANTTDYYGSGDANLDGRLDSADVTATQAMINGQTQPSNRADVDGNGKLDNADLTLIQNAAKGAVLPGWWDRLSTASQRNAWVDKALARDQTNQHPYAYWWVCLHFSSQLFINFSGYREDLAGTFFGGGQKGFNLPMYIVSVNTTGLGHETNAMLVGDNPLNFTHWRFIEPQTDETITPGAWNMPYGATLKIGVPTQIFEGGLNDRTLVSFYIDENGWSLVERNVDLLVTRPPVPAGRPDNRTDLWNPVILSSAGKILFEHIGDGLARQSDIYLSSLPFTDPPADTPLHLTQVAYSRILDAVEDPGGAVHLLWTGKPDYTPGVFYGQLDPASGKVANIAQISTKERHPLTGRILLTPTGALHVFFYEQKSNIYQTYPGGIYWSSHTTAGWQPLQNITPDVPSAAGQLSQPAYSHDSGSYFFDVAAAKNGDVFLVYAPCTRQGSYPNNVPVLMKIYHSGVWGPAAPVAGSNLILYGIGVDLAIDSGDVLHLIYWTDSDIYNLGWRGNLYHLMFDGASWSAPEAIDESGTAGYARAVVGLDDTLFVVWEKVAGEQVAAVWNQYARREWDYPRMFSPRQNADVWYPSVHSLADGRLLFAWSSRSPDYVTIETQYARLLQLDMRLFIPVMQNQAPVE